ncbi:hypothetical protein [Granulicella sp. L60]|nr:hypothetical protein [Granulicella sp. L60]
MRSIVIVFCLALTASPASAKVQFYSTFSSNGVAAPECVGPT